MRVSSHMSHPSHHVPIGFDTCSDTARNSIIAKLNLSEKMREMEVDLRPEFKHIFEPIPHVDRLPTDVIARIKLKDSSKTITTRSYALPKKYTEAWGILLMLKFCSRTTVRT